MNLRHLSPLEADHSLPAYYVYSSPLCDTLVDTTFALLGGVLDAGRLLINPDKVYQEKAELSEDANGFGKIINVISHHEVIALMPSGRKYLVRIEWPQQVMPNGERVPDASFVRYLKGPGPQVNQQIKIYPSSPGHAKAVDFC